MFIVAKIQTAFHKLYSVVWKVRLIVLCNKLQLIRDVIKLSCCLANLLRLFLLVMKAGFA